MNLRFLMRWRLAFTACLLFSASFSGAYAQNLTDPVIAPWQENVSANTYTDFQISEPVKPSRQEADIVPRRLSLQDIEKITAGNASNLSTLEDAYAGRVIDRLSQFGYDLFDADIPPENARKIPAGTVQDDYILSEGDTLDITVRGQENFRRTYKVESNGMLVIDALPPLSVAGRTLGELRLELDSAASQMHNTQIFASLSGARQVDVSIIGHVKKPGHHTLTAFHTVMDALALAGGVRKTGSLRQIKLVRAGKSDVIDLYTVLIQGTGRADQLLRDGDRIIVPPIGPTVAVSGAVKRPGIYEIQRGDRLTLSQMLALGGGPLLPGDNRLMKLDVTSQGQENVEDMSVKDTRRLFGDGAILSVAQAERERHDEVTLSGHTRQPGVHDLKKAKSLSGLLPDAKVLGQNIYPLIGVIARRDPDNLTQTLIEFSPGMVIKKKFDRQLDDGDTVYLFSMTQIRNLDDAPVQKPDDELLKQASFQLQKPGAKDGFIQDPAIVDFLRERAVFVRGSVRHPGGYPVAGEATLNAVLAAAGGMTREAHEGNIEVTSRLVDMDESVQVERRTVSLTEDNPDIITVIAGDTVRVNQKFKRIEDQSVMITGEVRFPGKYDLMPGDTMLTLLDRAGGITEQGYPDGVIFSRANERKREESRYRAQARDLELKLAASLQQVDDDKKPDMTQVSAVQNLIAQLKGAQAVGRITIEADPGVLIADPDQDILLEAGDRIYIPQRPLTVRVGGEVLSPAALQFRKGKSPSDYIREAGGTTYFADTDRAFVIYPDGSAKPLQVSAWNHSATFIPPGSTIIVPRDPKPFDFLESAERVSQILANLAISGLYVEAIADDN